MSRFQEALRAANNLRLLAAVGRSGGELSSSAHLNDHVLGSPLQPDTEPYGLDAQLGALP